MNEEAIRNFKNLCEELKAKMSNEKMLLDLAVISTVNPQNYKSPAARMRKFTVKLTSLMKKFRKASLEIHKQIPVNHRKVKAA